MRLLPLISLLLLTGVALAQDDSVTFHQTSTWATAGIGRGFMPGSGSLAGKIALSYQQGAHLYTVRVFSVSEFAIGVEHNLPSPDQWLVDYAVMYGRAWHRPTAYWSVSAGLGFVRGARRGALLNPLNLLDHESIGITTLGIAFDAHMFAVPVPHIGIGIAASSNLNPQKSFAGIMVCLHIGDID
jgi:hypothetical protein